MATKSKVKKATPKAKPRTKAKATAKTAKPRTKAKPASAKSGASQTDALAMLTKAFAGKRAFCEILWFRDKRKLAAKIFDWNAIDEAEKEDLVNDTFCD